MKLRSLFLASLAAIAMASCSNEENAAIDNGQPAAKDASLQFGISFSNAGTRAATVTEGEKEAGTEAEQAFTDATIVIQQGTNRNIMTVPFADFELSTATATHAPATLYLKEKIAVSEGAASVWVFLNASAALKASLATAGTDFATLKETAVLTATPPAIGGIGVFEDEGGIAEANHFLMSGVATTNASEGFTKGEINSLTVCVSRVASKLEQMLLTNSFDVADEAENLADAELKVTLTDYAYIGLQQEVAVLAGGTVTSSLYKPYGATIDFDYQAIGSTSTSNYCMENLTGTNLETTTNIVYKGVISVNGEVGDLYITSDNKAFTSIAEMAAGGYTYEGLTEETTIEDCWNTYALRKYEDGVCYYVGQIKTAGAGDAAATAKIVRNNIYRLNVSSISGLGTVLPQELTDPTLLDLTVEMDPWTVNLNSFEF